MPTGLKRHERRRRQRELIQQQKQQGKQYPPTCTHLNRKSDFKTVEEDISEKFKAGNESGNDHAANA